LLHRKFVANAEGIITATFKEKENTNEKIVNELGRSKRSSHQAGKVGKGTLGGFHVTGLTAFRGIRFRVGGSAAMFWQHSTGRSGSNWWARF
jgi:DNA ligase-1